MKKRLKKLWLLIPVVLAVFLVLNSIDAGQPVFDVGENLDTTSTANLLLDIFPVQNFDKDNGYYRLWTLIEPADVNIESDSVLKNYRDVHNPKIADPDYIQSWIHSMRNWKKRGLYTALNNKRKAILAKGADWVDPPSQVRLDWCRKIWENRDVVLELKAAYRVLLDRYQRLIDSPVFADFTLCVVKGEINYNTPIPNLLAWLHTAKIYNAGNVVRCLEGDWQTGMTNMLAHIEFAKRAIRGSRTLITNLVGKAVLRFSLQAVASLMNQESCPHTILEKVENLPAINYEEYGSRPLLIAEGFAVSQVKGQWPLLQKNRTKQYYYDYFTSLIQCEKAFPYTWGNYPLANSSPKKGLFWWVVNPLGKIRFDHFLGPHGTTIFDGPVHSRALFAVVHKSYWVKTLYDMVKISGYLHRHYMPEKPVEELLGEMEKSLITDPCSGKPYKWHREKQLLYSLGTDRDDDQGRIDTKSLDTDMAIPVVLFVPNQ